MSPDRVPHNQPLAPDDWPTPEKRRYAELQEKLAAEMPVSNFHELDGYGHMPWLEPGTRVKRLVSDFLDGPSARRG